MNSCDSKNNLLFINKNSDQQNINTFYTSCLQYIKNGKIVLLLTGSTKDLLPIIKEAKLSETELKRFAVITVDSFDACIQKLCEQHDWAWIPALIIVDLRTIFVNSASQNLENLNTTEVISSPPKCFQQLALCIANLFDYCQSVLKRIEKRTTISSGFVQSVFSILIVNDNSTYLSSKQIELIINLYFYKNNAFENVQEILMKIAL